MSSQCIRLSIVSVCWFFIFQLNGAAQQAPGLPTVRPDRLDQLDLPHSPVVPLPSAPFPETPPLSPPLPRGLEPLEFPSTADSVFVKEIRFVGNTVLSTEELEAVTASYVNRRLTFSELLEARSAVTTLYVQSGYITSGAYLAAEDNQAVDPEAAVFTLRIVEGRVEDIVVTGDSRLEQYVRSRLRRAIEPVLNQRDLEEALRLLQVDPLVKRISANLSSGSQFDLSLLSVDVQAAPVFALEPELSNQRSPSSGSIEGALSGSATNLLGVGERLEVGYRATEGSDQWNFDLAVPVSPSNGSLSVGYSTLRARITEEPFDAFDVRANSRIYQLGFRQPLIDRANATATEQFALGLTASRLESETTLLGLPEPLSAGADAQGRTRLSVLRFSQDYARTTATSFVLARSELSAGLDIADTTVGIDGIDSEFLLWKGQAVWLRQVLGRSQLLVRGEIQLADSSLPSLEQFSLGGASSVRGYRQDAILSDNGVFGSIELQVPLLLSGESRLDIVPFFDAGAAWNANGNNLDRSSLAAVGLGLQYRLSDIIFLRVNYAVGLSDIDQGETLQENGLDFVLRGTFRF